MMRDRETLLAELPGASEAERVVLIHVLDQTTHQSRLELRQQSWAPRIGWFTQSSVQLTPEQVGGLRLSLGTGALRGAQSAGPTISVDSIRTQPNPAQPNPSRPARSESFVPRIVRAETA